MSLVTSVPVKKTLLRELFKAYGKSAIVLAIDKRASVKVKQCKEMCGVNFLKLRKAFKVEQDELSMPN